MNTIREIQKINDLELQRGIAGTPASWHAKYAQSPWVYVGNLDHALTEGDVICFLSQYGEVEDINLVREEDTGKSKGFAFAKYEDARSCILAVDNFCGIQVCGRSIRIDHVEKYRLPKHLAEKDQPGVDAPMDASRGGAGHAYQHQELANEFSLHQGHDLFAPVQRQNQPKISRQGPSVAQAVDRIRSYDDNDDDAARKGTDIANRKPKSRKTRKERKLEERSNVYKDRGTMRSKKRKSSRRSRSLSEDGDSGSSRRSDSKTRRRDLRLLPLVEHTDPS